MAGTAFMLIAGCRPTDEKAPAPSSSAAGADEEMRPKADEATSAIPVTTENIKEGMLVFRNPHWDSTWGSERDHPRAGVLGRVRAWTDMQGNKHGRRGADAELLQEGGLASVYWFDEDVEESQTRAAYRIGLEHEYWLATDQKVVRR